MRRGTVVLRGMSVRRVVAAPNVTAAEAQTKMHPGVPARQTLFAATRGVRGVILRRSQMRAELHPSGHRPDETRPPLISSNCGQHAGATVEFRDVSKGYPGQLAVDGLSFTVPAGKICILSDPAAPGRRPR